MHRASAEAASVVHALELDRENPDCASSHSQRWVLAPGRAAERRSANELL